MNKVSAQDTFDIFLGSGALRYSWYQVTGFPDEPGDGDSWTLHFEEVEDADDQEDFTSYTLTHQDIMRAVRKIASKDGLEHFSTSSRTRKHCQYLAFGNLDETDFDAAMADNVIQFAAFGKVVYG